MTYATITGYPFDGYDGTGESFEQLQEQQPVTFQIASAGVLSQGTKSEVVYCTSNPAHGPAEVPWSGERLCWDCADHALDLLALALQSEDGLPVQVKAR